MRKGLATVCLALLATLGVMKGQTSIGMDSVNYSYNATVTFNSTDTFKVTARNLGPQTYTGMLHFIYAVDTASNGSPLQLVQLADDSTFVSLQTNDTVSDQAAIPIYPGVFRHGINTVVIWPRASSGGAAFTTHDSLFLYVFVDTVADVHDLSLTLDARLFPNPAQQVLYMQVKDAGNKIERVRFFSAEGRLLKETCFTGKLDVSDLVPGIYFIELTGSKGTAARYKIIKE